VCYNPYIKEVLASMISEDYNNNESVAKILEQWNWTFQV